MTDQTNEPAPRRFWRLGPITTLIVVTVVLSAIFILIPGLDLWFSRQFYDPQLGFPASRVPAFVWLRDLSEWIVWLVCAVLLVSVVVKLVLPRRPSLVPVRTTLFLSATLALGPGLLVNGILKAFWGRPRPVEVVDFGGDAPFVSAWHFSDFCAANCSFVSGEASFGIWLVALALVVPARWRRPVAAGAVVLAAVFSINRIAFGGHFLSDVLLSWALTLLVIALVHHFLFVRPPRWLEPDALEGAMASAGLGIRNLIRRRPVESGGAAAGAVPSLHEAEAAIRGVPDEFGRREPTFGAPEFPEAARAEPEYGPEPLADEEPFPDEAGGPQSDEIDEALPDEEEPSDDGRAVDAPIVAAEAAMAEELSEAIDPLPPRAVEEERAGTAEEDDIDRDVADALASAMAEEATDSGDGVADAMERGAVEGVIPLPEPVVVDADPTVPDLQPGELEPHLAAELGGDDAVETPNLPAIAEQAAELPAVIPVDEAEAALDAAERSLDDALAEEPPAEEERDRGKA